MPKASYAKISIVMCTYNGEKYLREQLDSLISQTYPLYEILVQDDVSTDGTLQILKEYEQRYPIIHVLQNEKNMGYNANFSSAIYKATGDYLAISDQDDIWMPNKIERLMSNIGNKGMIFSKSVLFDENAPEWKEHNYYSAPNVSLEELAFRNNISGHAVLVRRDLLDRVPFWDSRYYYDWWLAIVAAYFDEIVFLDETLVRWRRHQQSITHQFYVTSKSESRISKFFRLNDFLYRRKNYLNSLYRMLYKLEEHENKHPEFVEAVRLTRDNDLFRSLKSCYKCLKMRSIYHPELSNCSFKSMKDSFMKPVYCSGF